MKYISKFLFMICLATTAIAQQKPVYERTRTNQVLSDYAMWAKYFLSTPHGIDAPSFPTYVPDSLKHGALYYRMGFTAPGLYVYDQSWKKVSGDADSLVFATKQWAARFATIGSNVNFSSLLVSGIYIGPPNVNGHVIATGASPVSFGSVVANDGISGAGGQLYRLSAGLLDFLRGDQVTSGFRLTTNGTAANPVTTFSFGYNLTSDPGYGYDNLQYNGDGTRKLTWKGSRVLTRAEIDTVAPRFNPAYGTIYNTSNFTSLSDFTLSGGITASVSGGALLVTNSVGVNFNQTLDLKGSSYNLPNWSLEDVMEVPAATSISSGSAGIKGGSGGTSHQIQYLLDLGNSANAGRLLLSNEGGGALVTAPTKLIYVPGDIVKVILTRLSYTKIQARAVNLTTPCPDVVVTYDAEYNKRTSLIQNTGTFSIFATSTNVVKHLSFRVYSNTPRYADLAILSDSKLGGYLNSTYGITAFAKMSLYYNAIHLSGGDNTALGAIKELPELMRLKPKVFIIDLGYNDINTGLVSVDTAIARLTTLYTALTNNGSKVYFCTGQYETLHDNAPLAAAIKLAFPNNYIDTYAWTKATPGVVALDAIHLADVGQEVVGNGLLAMDLVPDIKTPVVYPQQTLVSSANALPYSATNAAANPTYTVSNRGAGSVANNFASLRLETNTSSVTAVGVVALRQASASSAASTLVFSGRNAAGTFVDFGELNSLGLFSVTNLNLSGLTASQDVVIDASKNLVSNSITGSGSGVRATAPTLITPKLTGYTVSTLPAGTVGMIAYVTDAAAPTYLGTLTGGGSIVTPVFYNGTAWVSH
jgi:hypothetical protein